MSVIAGIEQFREATGYNIGAFFNQYRAFVANDYQNIINYYNGDDRVASSFEALNQLNRQITMIEPLIDLYRNRFQTIDAWTIIDAYSDIFVAVETVNNMDRWTRSNRTTQYNSNVQVQRVLRQGETFESVFRNQGLLDYDNEWTLVAIGNYINEEDYTPDGGAIFTVSVRENVDFGLPNIVDNLSVENVYGKDIRRDIIFENNDLITVTGTAAVRQTIETIFQTRRGSIPEFPEDGIEEAVIGTNVNTIQYPTIFRNLLNIFRKDARFTEINLLDLFRDQDAVFMRIEIKALLKDAFVTNLNI